jgi:hypothetical protein
MPVMAVVRSGYRIRWNSGLAVPGPAWHLRRGGQRLELGDTNRVSTTGGDSNRGSCGAATEDEGSAGENHEHGRTL